MPRSLFAVAFLSLLVAMPAHAIGPRRRSQTTFTHTGNITTRTTNHGINGSTTVVSGRDQRGRAVFGIKQTTYDGRVYTATGVFQGQKTGPTPPPAPRARPSPGGSFHPKITAPAAELATSEPEPPAESPLAVPEPFAPAAPLSPEAERRIARLTDQPLLFGGEVAAGGRLPQGGIHPGALSDLHYHDDLWHAVLVANGGLETYAFRRLRQGGDSMAADAAWTPGQEELDRRPEHESERAARLSKLRELLPESSEGDISGFLASGQHQVLSSVDVVDVLHRPAGWFLKTASGDEHHFIDTEHGAAEPFLLGGLRVWEAATRNRASGARPRPTAL